MFPSFPESQPGYCIPDGTAKKLLVGHSRNYSLLLIMQLH
jgi:hypothetical protein